MTTSLTVNGLPVAQGTLSLPRQGVWGAQLLLDTDQPPTGACSVKWDGGLTLSGTAFRGGEVEGSSVVAIRGGAGGLWRSVKAKGYKSTPLRIPLTDILQGVGEKLSQKSDSAILSRTLPHWVTQEGQAGNALFALLADLDDVVWRMLSSGEVWVGKETWESAQDFPYDLIEENPKENTFIISADAPTLLPGQTFRQKKVSYVEHDISAHAFRSRIWLEDA